MTQAEERAQERAQALLEEAAEAGLLVKAPMGYYAPKTKRDHKLAKLVLDLADLDRTVAVTVRDRFGVPCWKV